MKLPHTRTIAYRVLQILYKSGSLSQSDLVDAATAHFNRQHVVKAVRTLRDESIVLGPDKGRAMPSDMLSLSEDMRDLIEESERTNHKYRGQIVPRRESNVFATTLSKANIPSALGMRAGSNDHLQWPSKFA